MKVGDKIVFAAILLLAVAVFLAPVIADYFVRM